jgi:hypothetical protein
MLPVALGLGVLEDAGLFLGALWLLDADEARDPTTTDFAAGAETAGSSTDAIASPLELAAATTAVIVETEPKEIALTSPTGDSTTGDTDAVAAGIGAASFCEKDVD